MLSLPFFEPAHRALSTRLDAFARESVEPFTAAADEGDPIAAGRGFLDRAAAADLRRFRFSRRIRSGSFVSTRAAFPRAIDSAPRATA